MEALVGAIPEIPAGGIITHGKIAPTVGDDKVTRVVLSPEQIEHWEQTLENAERLRENALRMLGRLPLELGLRDGEG